LAKRRSREQVIRDILEMAMGEGTSITHVAFRASLTSGQASEYLQYLIQHGLMEQRLDKKKGRKIFHTTPKGIRFISVADGITELMAKDSLYVRDSS
jgi:predicted transcriptional regulator